MKQIRPNLDLARHAPLGLEADTERRWYLFLLGGAAVYSAGAFFVRYLDARDDLYHSTLGKRVLWEGAVMPDFAEILGDALSGFALLALVCLGAAAWHYLFHYQGSKSVYTMRRLPRRWELHRRCLTLPAVGLALCAALALAVLLLYYAVYLTATPAQCLTPGQWQKLWR